MQTAYYTGRAYGIHSAYSGSKTACSTLVRYHVLYNAFKKMTFSFSEDEKHALFLSTAENVYSLAD
ncbi:MAG: hypothetical protein VYD74_06255 [Pseudomonadota bacterium]|nr:hypothetical protein [Pseudomonadota bacterium]